MGMTVAILGATGRTGRELIAQGKARGLKLKALARDPSRLNGLDVEVVKGDVQDEAALTRLFTGVDAVLSGLGPATPFKNGIQSAGMPAIIAAMKTCGVKRYVAVTSAAAVLPGEKPGALVRGAFALSRVLLPGYVRDKRAEVDALVSADLEWTLVRVPGALVDGTGRDVEISLDWPRGMPVAAQRQAVARVMLDAVVEKKWIRQAPFTPGKR
jgi:uncharacterized protein YbjT (DUF2867 family)